MSEWEKLQQDYIDLVAHGAPALRKFVRTQQAPAELENFCGDPRVMKVSIVKNTEFTFFTRPLVMTVGSPIECNYRLLGSMGCTIFGSNRSVLCENIDNPRRRNRSEVHVFPHPHINTEGVPCFTLEAREFLRLWFIDAMYTHIAAYMLRFFEEAHQQSSYIMPSHWPALTVEEAHIWKSDRPSDTNLSSIPQPSIPSPSPLRALALADRLRAFFSRN